MPGAGILAEGLVHLHNLHDTECLPHRTAVCVIPQGNGQETDADIAGGAPGVTDFSRPLPRLRTPPFAHAEEDGTSGHAKGVAHQGISPAGIDIGCIAPVIFQVIDSPLGVHESILILVPEAARITGAGIGAGIAVNAQFQALSVEIVGQSLHPRRELLRVLVDKALRIPLSVPAVVQVEIDISGIHKAVLDHLVGDVLDQGLVDIRLELVPGTPPHLRRVSQSFPLRERLVGCTLGIARLCGDNKQ